MGGKGRKRREKNYKAAHGGYTALPPPPKSSQLDALPFKLRQIISFTKLRNDSPGLSKINKLDNKQSHIVKQVDSSEPLKEPQHSDEQLSENDKNMNKKKRKRKEVTDLRFAMEEDKTKSQQKRKERKKKYEAKKKHKKVQEDDDLDFPGQENIKFGDIVQAPPKLSFIPKAFKVTTQDASHERLRLRAIEEYRSRKGWTSRPGNHRPPPVTASDP